MLQVYYLTFMCRSTCFGCLHAHHQELTTALTASGFTLERGGSSVVSRVLAGYKKKIFKFYLPFPVKKN
jgi:hypothetical protein